MTRSRAQLLSTGVGAALLLAVLATILSPPPHAAAADGCLAEEGLRDPGTAMPVIMVHGWRGSTSQWDAFESYLDTRTDRLAVTRFDYSTAHTQWVTYNQIAPRLRRYVLCLADVSLANGGIGKVGIVGHSMGGLAAREALADGPDGRGPLNDEVAYVATFGTPHDGSHAGTDRIARFAVNLLDMPGVNVLDQMDRHYLEWIAAGNPSRGIGSDAAARALLSHDLLGRLPPFPDQVPVRSVAGDYVERRRLGFHIGPPFHAGDAVVSASSATQHAREVDGIGGSEVHECILVGPFSLISGTYEARLTSDITGGTWGCLHTKITGIDRVVQSAFTELIVASSREPRTVPDPNTDDADAAADALIDAYYRANELCRGGTGAEWSTWDACNDRTHRVYDLVDAGWCPSDLEGWRPCNPGETVDVGPTAEQSCTVDAVASSLTSAGEVFAELDEPECDGIDATVTGTDATGQPTTWTLMWRSTSWTTDALPR